ncbi:MAG: hypothetical protein MUD01_20235 [Chloroflexaceae bacterium]|nr:hypothetical protein [Chloroflexaceae bacterium]
MSQDERAGWVNHPHLLCGRCQVPLQVRRVNVAYLGNAFPVELLRCPQCGLTFVPEELALGKMAEVEQALEDK